MARTQWPGDDLAQLIAVTLWNRGYEAEQIEWAMSQRYGPFTWDTFAKQFIDPVDDLCIEYHDTPRPDRKGRPLCECQHAAEMHDDGGCRHRQCGCAAFNPVVAPFG